MTVDSVSIAVNLTGVLGVLLDFAYVLGLYQYEVSVVLVSPHESIAVEFRK
jgi:hypothetical protein